MQTSSTSSERVGNTKQLSPSLHWCFTLNNYTDSEYNDIKFHSSIKNCVIGKEVGESGTPHLQGYICFDKKIRPKSLGLTDRIHWEKCRNINASIEYCQKDDPEPYIKNCKRHAPPYRMELPNPYPWQQDIINIVKDKPNERTIHWFWEPKGCAGKTTLQKHLLTHYNGIVILSGKAADMKNAIVNYQEKNGILPTTVLINIPRSVEHISYTGIEEIKDMMFFSGKYEGGMVCGPNPHVIIFANEEPVMDEMSLDRWDIRRI